MNEYRRGNPVTESGLCSLEITRDFLSKKKPVALIATGGYGRGELSPHSDIDLMFLYPRSASGKALESLKETMTREILYPLWDLGMKVGHATRAVKETLDESRRDIRTKNALLDSRYICGDKKVLQIQSQGTLINVFFGILTLGIYSPHTGKILCG